VYNGGKQEVADMRHMFEVFNAFLKDEFGTETRGYIGAIGEAVTERGIEKYIIVYPHDSGIPFLAFDVGVGVQIENGLKVGDGVKLTITSNTTAIWEFDEDGCRQFPQVSS
jgi:hypothetical protein